MWFIKGRPGFPGRLFFSLREQGSAHPHAAHWSDAIQPKCRPLAGDDGGGKSTGRVDAHAAVGRFEGDEEGDQGGHDERGEFFDPFFFFHSQDDDDE